MESTSFEDLKIEIGNRLEEISNCLLKNIDIDLMTILQKDEPKRMGLDFSTNLRENLEIHAEYSYSQNELKYLTTNDLITQRKIDGSSYLFGLRFLNLQNMTLIVEYFYNNSGLSKNEFKSYIDYLKYSVESNNPELINSVKLNMSTIFRSKTLMQNYLYVKLIQPEPFSWLYSSISVFSIYNLADKSFLLSPQLRYKPYTNFEVLLWPILFIGKNNTEYGSKQFQKKVEIWMRFFF